MVGGSRGNNANERGDWEINPSTWAKTKDRATYGYPKMSLLGEELSPKHAHGNQSTLGSGKTQDSQMFSKGERGEEKAYVRVHQRDLQSGRVTKMFHNLHFVQSLLKQL
jgi:hypothetical protein